MTKNQTTKHFCGATVLDAHDQIHHVGDLARPDILRGGNPHDQIHHVGDLALPDSIRGGTLATRIITW